MSTLTLDDIAALEALLVEATPGPWERPASEHPGPFNARAIDGPDGELVCAAYAADDARLIAAAVNALPALLALARRALEADAAGARVEGAASVPVETTADDMRHAAAILCRTLAEQPPPSADAVERALWRVACDTCADKVAAVGVRVTRLVLPEGGAP